MKEERARMRRRQAGAANCRCAASSCIRFSLADTRPPGRGLRALRGRLRLRWRKTLLALGSQCRCSAAHGRNAEDLCRRSCSPSNKTGPG
ncbi:centromere protein X isoform X2 [Petaurus breviceps papuanus]|uniref:centromere protein X isoform X2 n=1 Tax=Petaurus breviceps papuanus TaxID=3040969 RepID=UPI0036DB9392